jgi:hypothetical protein
MTALLLSMMLAQATVAAPEETPSSAPAEAGTQPSTPAPEAAPAPVAAPKPPAQPLWKTLPDHPVFVRAFSAAVLGVGAGVATLGLLGLGTMLTARFSPVLNKLSEDNRSNAVAVCTLAAATGLVLGGVLMVGGVAGLLLP